MTVANERSRSILVQIVAQNRLIRSGLRLLVESGPDMIVVGESPSVRDACAAEGGSFADVIVVDLENESTASLLELHSARSDSRLIVLLGSHGAERPVLMPDCASGIVYTQFAEQSLVPTIHAVYHHRASVAPFSASRPIIAPT
jgi:DNA-binding NarL/FixJ family response regulator